MKVFISWSGAKSKDVALALRRWIPDIIQTIEPWMSEHDIQAGARWNKEIAAQLNDTRFGIICLTKENHSAPWLLFEAGALAKTLEDTHVCPYFIEMEPTEIPQGPLTQFQGKRAREKETWELISTINDALKDGAIPPDRLRRAFEKFWPDLEKKLHELPAETDESPPNRTPEDMIEEILDLVRGISRASTIERSSLVGLGELYRQFLTDHALDFNMKKFDEPAPRNPVERSQIVLPRAWLTTRPTDTTDENRDKDDT